MMFPKPKRKQQPERRRLWRAARERMLKARPWCELCSVKATEVHHRRGREGDLIRDERFLMCVCSACHRHIHANPAWAYERGYLLKRNVLG